MCEKVSQNTIETCQAVPSNPIFSTVVGQNKAANFLSNYMVDHNLTYNNVTQWVAKA